MIGFRNFANGPKILDIILPPCNKHKQISFIAKKLHDKFVVQFVDSEINLQKKNISSIFWIRIPDISAHRPVGKVQGGSNMTGTDLCVNKPLCAAAVRP